VKRRSFVMGMAAVISTAGRADALQGVKVARIGYLADNPAPSPLRTAFLQGLRELGYVEGRNLVIEYRYAEGKVERLRGLAAELAGLNVDVIFAAAAALPAKQATSTVPIVFPAASDPVANGLVTSLARPGGNATGLSFFTPALVGKSLELLKQALPRASRIALLRQPGALSERMEKDMFQAAEVAARTLEVRLEYVEARRSGDLDRAFSEMTRARTDALTVVTSTMFFIDRSRLADLATKHRLPTMFPWREGVDAGGLLSYGAHVPDLFRRAATYVDKILKGAQPGDLPVEQPTRFELVLNLKTARALGLTIPPSLLLRADQVIE
jgi:putative ABC transport system substrate-binding protein